jgi:putative ABC transport system permease protein
MISSYLKLAWRNIRSQKTVAFINIFGLAIAIGTCITVFLFLKNYRSLDLFHTHGSHIFMVEYRTQTDGTDQIWGNTPIPVASVLANDFSQVERTVRISRAGVQILHKDAILEEVLTYADTGFFNMFTFPLRYGDPAALNDPHALILSSKTAEKYFGNENPVGRQLTLRDNNRQETVYTVQGVAEKFPGNTGFAFDVLAGWNMAHATLRDHDWKTRSDGIFVQLHQPEDTAWLASQLQPLIAQFNAVNPEYTATRFVFDNLSHPNDGAFDVINRPAEASHPAVTLMYTLVAVLMMALSCFNYVNIALGSVVHRLREIGVRKSLGGNKRQIIVQFMTENLLLCFLAFIAGLVLAQVVFIPVQNQIMVIQSDAFWKDIHSVWGFLVGLLAFTAVVSGAYPALYVSRFNATAIFSGKQQFGEKSVLRRTMLGTQFVLAYVAVIVSVVFFVAGREFRKMPWGYDAGHTLVVPLHDSTQFSMLKNEILKTPGVEVVAGAAGHVGYGLNRENILVEGQQQEIVRFDVGSDYDRAMGLPMKSGRFFLPGEHEENTVVVSSFFAEQRGWSDPLGKTIRVNQQDYVICGVMADIKIVPTNAPQQAVFFKSTAAQQQYLVARFAAGTGNTLAEKATKDFQRLFGSLPARPTFQNEVFDNFDRTYQELSQSFSYISLLALIIACMGLYGLAAQHYFRRMKEVSVRKLLGATAGQIALLINRHFAVLLLLSGLLASGGCWVITHLLLKNMTTYIGYYRPGILPFILANVVVLSAALATIGHQTWKMAQVKLAETLKNAA